MKEASEEHDAIVTAILRGDAERARDSLEEHVEAGRLRLQEAVRRERTE